ncbi:hypothetical protein [Granulicella sp. S156]|uniref:hypothetical protein n=1 Tax=Granulicella sp. S156 TaxID=1747224 RepID=UPI00131C44D1|nr:hypothetical protein [Granulicella sp. S156]
MYNVAPPLIWPLLLELPPADRLIVYLDLNHWIGLSKALAGHPQGAMHRDVLEACRHARSTRRALFVLSGTVYAEAQNIKDPRQRRSLANVIEELTDFNTLVGRHIVMATELSAVLDPIAKLPNPHSKVPLIGRGIRHAFGVQSGFAIQGPSGDETEGFRQRYGAEAFDAYMKDSMLRMERSILRGPVDSNDEADLRALGYKPEGPAAVAESRAEQEREFKKILDSDPKSRRGRLDDFVSARELIIEFQDILPRSLKERGIALTDVMQDPESGRRLVRSMPSTDVSIVLKAAWHRNRQRTWTVNDIYDIDALALATPYCDVVVTEKACHHILTTAKMAERMNTSLLQHLADLPAVLQNRMSKRLSSTHVM